MKDLSIGSPVVDGDVVVAGAVEFTVFGTPSQIVSYSVDDVTRGSFMISADLLNTGATKKVIDLSAGWRVVKFWYDLVPDEGAVEAKLFAVVPLTSITPAEGATAFVVDSIVLGGFGMPGFTVRFSVDDVEHGHFQLPGEKEGTDVTPASFASVDPVPSLSLMGKTAGDYVLRVWYDGVPNSTVTQTFHLWDPQGPLKALTVSSPQSEDRVLVGSVPFVLQGVGEKKVLYALDGASEAKGSFLLNMGIGTVGVEMPDPGMHIVKFWYEEDTEAIDGGGLAVAQLVIVVPPLTLTAPTDDAPVVAPSESVNFAGTGAGKEQLVYAVDGVEAGKLTIPAAQSTLSYGEWSTSITMPSELGQHSIEFWYAQLPSHRVEKTVSVGRASITITSPAAGAVVANGEVEATGEATPQEEMNYTIGDESGTVTADDSGKWTFTMTLESGEHTLTVDYKNPGEQDGKAATVTFRTMAVVVVDSPEEGAWIVGTSSVTFSGTADANTSLEYLAKLAGLDGTVTVGATGSWSLPLQLGGGQHAVKFTPRASDGTAVESLAVERTVRVVPISGAEISMTATASRVNPGQLRSEVAR